MAKTIISILDNDNQRRTLLKLANRLGVRLTPIEHSRPESFHGGVGAAIKYVCEMSLQLVQHFIHVWFVNRLEVPEMEFVWEKTVRPQSKETRPFNDIYTLYGMA